MVRRKRQLKEPILLVTNGKNREQDYLRALKKELDGTKYHFDIRFINGEPETIIQKLEGPRGDTSAYTQIWIIVDEDGMDRTSFLKACERRSTKKQQWYGIVSRPCFEVWLIAHFQQVHRYTHQQEAVAHFAEIQPGLKGKSLPIEFPVDKRFEAIDRSVLAGIRVGGIRDLPPSPGSGMAHLVKAFNGGVG